MTLRLGVDVGGTFTDVALTESESGKVWVTKQLTTPDDPSEAIMAGAEEALANAGTDLSALDQFVHGTTLASNVVLERKGIGVALLTTRGFRDVLLIGRQKRHDIYRLDVRKPAPLLLRRDIYEVTERMRGDGTVEQPLDRIALAELAEGLVRSNLASLAICFINSYVNPAHEIEARDLIREIAPNLPVSISAEVSPQWREYERTNTTVVNAYVTPAVSAYLEHLGRRVRAKGLAAEVLVMQSNGGVGAASTARRLPVRLIESGPAAGVIMAANVAAELNEQNVVSFDMGGTTAKLAHIEEGSPRIVNSFEIDRVALNPGSGLPLSVPAVDLIEIGAGGGSIASVSALGLISVGPQSAGSNPGPICYGRGGNRPTVTDADLILGYLNPAFFVGGRMTLDLDAATDGIRRQIAEPLGLDVTEAAWAIHELINTNMLAAARTASIERGVDPRRTALVATGGAAPAHAARLGLGLGVSRVIVPFKAGVASAFGLLAGEVKFDAIRTQRVPLRDGAARLGDDPYRELVQTLSQQVREAAGAEASRNVRFHRTADMRYVGQGYEVRVELPDRDLQPGDAPVLAAAFETAYRALYGRSDGVENVEIVNWRLEARLDTRASDWRVNGAAAPDALKGYRPAYFRECRDYVDCPVYDRALLKPGATIAGPALIEEPESTTVLLPDQQLCPHERGHLVMTIGGPA